MSMLNINDLYKEKNLREKNKIEIYSKVLEMCHKKILRAVKIDPYTESYFFIIPRYIYGVPLYKLDECLKFLVEKLTKNGFKLYYTHPNLLIISWKKTEEEVKQKNIELNPFTEINESSKTSNSNSNSNNNKDSFKSIYNSDILNKFNKTLLFN